MTSPSTPTPSSRVGKALLDLEHAGFLHKRRGGFGKFAVDSWKHRYFTITKTALLTYYESEETLHQQPVSDMKPRGRIDLRAVNFDFLKDIRSEGAPTAFVMQICPPNEEKWALCAPSREEYNIWCSIFERLHRDKVNNQSPPSSSHVYNSHGGILSYTSEEDNGGVRSRNSSPTSSKSGRSRSGSAGGSFTSSLRALGRSLTPTRQRGSSDHSKDSNEHNVDKQHKLARGSGQGQGPGGKGVVGTGGGMKNTHGKPTPSRFTTSTVVPSSQSNTSSSAPTHPSLTKKGSLLHMGKKKNLKVAVKKSGYISADGLEWLLTLVIMNFCFSLAYMDGISKMASWVYFILANVVVGRTLLLRLERLSDNHAHQLQQAKTAAEEGSADITVIRQQSTIVEDLISQSEKDKPTFNLAKGEKPPAGMSFPQSLTAPRQSPDHTWCKCDHRQFQVRIGPQYDRFKKKAPSAAPLFEIIAVDCFCTKNRLDHATQRFQLPDSSHIQTHHPHVPPFFVVQIQIPADPPPSLFSNVEDGPGWSILMYYRITEETCRQLKSLATASPAVQLFANWCEKAPTDAAWRGRFKVINSCTNLEELGMPSAIVSYNAKPVLIRRTGTLFKGPNYIEFNIHVHKFANLAKQSIHLITSRCNVMYMQIGFVIEGRDDKELPEVLFGCVAVNKPQEDQAEFLFDEV